MAARPFLSSLEMILLIVSAGTLAYGAFQEQMLNRSLCFGLSIMLGYLAGRWHGKSLFGFFKWAPKKKSETRPRKSME